MIEPALLESARSYRPHTRTVTQSYSGFRKYKLHPAFQDWISRLNKGDRLPRGRFLQVKRALLNKSNFC